MATRFFASKLPKQIALVVAVVAFLLIAAHFGAFERLRAPSELKKTLVGLGPWGYVAFVTAYAAFQPFGIPGTVFVVAASLIWPWPIAFALSMVGTMAASVVGFSFARYLGREALARRIPERFRKYDDALEHRAFTTVFVLRLIFWMPPLLHAFFGISKVRFSTHFWGSLAGYVIPLLLMSYFGQRLFDWFAVAIKDGSVQWIALVLGVAAVVGALVLLRRRRRP